MKRRLLSVILILSLTACGNNAPLTLTPETPQPPVQTIPQETDSSAEHREPFAEFGSFMDYFESEKREELLERIRNGRFNSFASLLREFNGTFVDSPYFREHTASIDDALKYYDFLLQEAIPSATENLIPDAALARTTANPGRFFDFNISSNSINTSNSESAAASFEPGSGYIIVREDTWVRRSYIVGNLTAYMPDEFRARSMAEINRVILITTRYEFATSYSGMAPGSSVSVRGYKAVNEISVFDYETGAQIANIGTSEAAPPQSSGFRDGNIPRYILADPYRGNNIHLALWEYFNSGS
jgi:predicted small lipoprotein YifL